MSLKEKRNRPRTPDVEPDLLEQGISQLELEIRTLQDWIGSIGPGEVEHRRSYEDMLRSRQEMLVSLKRQQTELAQKSSK
ncbi:hypothetical protein [Pseudohongiella spirulinae]|uniref:Uncharacterized protein n=1 Tax=Pseudohongiella spirulinae TaxID=1249552 RepID=A0A0S2KD05_9GAMM|nr:hypothetical protein [Pseudohongiella spirulinae]ALO46121.1 hypothetical protein PS2015_1464 [Pseudohongiella spirulinae]